MTERGRSQPLPGRRAAGHGGFGQALLARQGDAGLAAVAASAGLTMLVAALGPSAMEPPLPGRAGQPPYALAAHPSAYLVVPLAAAALTTGMLGLALCLGAARRGWRPPPRLLLAGGLALAAVVACLPPFGSADHLSYAAYGRMLVTGHDPYATGPDVLGHDPIARAVEDWRTTPSVYGPLAMAAQALASLAGGTSVRLTVFVLSLLNLAAFAGTGLLLHGLARGDRDRQVRAALLWTANPLLLYELVAGAHVDTLAVVFAVAALAVLPAGRRAAAGTAPGGQPRGAAARWRAAARCAAAGTLIGLGAAVKLTAVLAGGGLAWAALRLPGRRPLWLAALAAGFAAAVAAGGPHLLHQVVRGGSFVSIGSPWRGVRTALAALLGAHAASNLVTAGSVLLALVLLAVALRGLPRDGHQAGREHDGFPVRPGRGPLDPAIDRVAQPADAARAALACTLAWLFAWPYVLPWYDALAWALLPLLAWSWVDWLVLARTAALAFGYLPARGAAAGLPAGLGWLQSVVRTGVTPAALALLTAALVVACAAPRGRRPGGGRPSVPRLPPTPAGRTRHAGKT